MLDEIDKLVLKSGDEVLYNLTRMNSDLMKAKVNIIGISNDLNYEEEIIFPPYNALQIKDILEDKIAVLMC